MRDAARVSAAPDPLDGFAAFTAAVRARLEQGRTMYRDLAGRTNGAPVTLDAKVEQGNGYA